MESPRSLRSGNLSCGANMNLKRLTSELEQSSLETTLSQTMPTRFLQIFEGKWSLQTLDKSKELRQEIVSWLEILLENIGVKQMYINFPKPYSSKQQSKFPKYPPVSVIEAMSRSEAELQVRMFVLPKLNDMFNNEHLFLENLSDCLQRTASDEQLSDSQKCLIRFDRPWHSNDSQKSDQNEIVDVVEIQSQIEEAVLSEATSNLADSESNASSLLPTQPLIKKPPSKLTTNVPTYLEELKIEPQDSNYKATESQQSQQQDQQDDDSENQQQLDDIAVAKLGGEAAVQEMLVKNKKKRKNNKRKKNRPEDEVFKLSEQSIVSIRGLIIRYGLDADDLVKQNDPNHEKEIEKKLEKSITLIQQDNVLQSLLLKVQPELLKQKTLQSEFNIREQNVLSGQLQLKLKIAELQTQLKQQELHHQKEIKNLKQELQDSVKEKPKKSIALQTINVPKSATKTQTENKNLGLIATGVQTEQSLEIPIAPEQEESKIETLEQYQENLFQMMLSNHNSPVVYFDNYQPESKQNNDDDDEDDPIVSTIPALQQQKMVQDNQHKNEKLEQKPYVQSKISNRKKQSNKKQ